jgi:broad specificity phosphatase PhoE
MTNPVGRSGGDGQSSDARMIMLIRHAEKPLHPYGSPRGVNPDGQPDPHSLTVTGWIRAGALVELLAPSRGDPPGELRRPDTIYASAHAGGHSKRSMQTVGPLASRLGLQVVKRYAAGDEAYLVREISRPSRRHARRLASRSPPPDRPPPGRGEPDPTSSLAARPLRRHLDLHPRTTRVALRPNTAAPAARRPALPNPDGSTAAKT